MPIPKWRFHGARVRRDEMRARPDRQYDVPFQKRASWGREGKVACHAFRKRGAMVDVMSVAGADGATLRSRSRFKNCDAQSQHRFQISMPSVRQFGETF